MAHIKPKKVSARQAAALTLATFIVISIITLASGGTGSQAASSGHDFVTIFVHKDSVAGSLWDGSNAIEVYIEGPAQNGRTRFGELLKVFGTAKSSCTSRGGFAYDCGAGKATWSGADNNSGTAPGYYTATIFSVPKGWNIILKQMSGTLTSGGSLRLDLVVSDKNLPTIPPPTQAPTATPTLPTNPTVPPLVSSTPNPNPTVTPPPGASATPPIPPTTPTPTGGDTVNCVSIRQNGDPASKMNIVMLPSQFTNQQEFIDQAKLAASSFDETNLGQDLLHKLNFWALPLLHRDYKVYFDGRLVYWDQATGTQDALACGGGGTVATLLIVNSQIYGGGACGFGCLNGSTTTEGIKFKVAPHEMGHAICSLNDEYTYAGVWPLMINCSINRSNDPNQPCPGWEKYPGSKCIEGCGVPYGKFRPEESSIMYALPDYHFNPPSLAGCRIALQEYQ